MMWCVVDTPEDLSFDKFHYIEKSNYRFLITNDLNEKKYNKYKKIRESMLLIHYKDAHPYLKH